MRVYITQSGMDVLSKALLTTGVLEFTRAELGDGIADIGTVKERTGLVNKVADAMLAGYVVNGATIQLGVQYSNTGLAAGFFVREIGIFCREPGMPEAEALYCYVTFGEEPDWIAAQTTALYVRTYDVITTVTLGVDVTVNVNPCSLLTRGDIRTGNVKLSAATSATANKLVVFEPPFVTTPIVVATLVYNLMTNRIVGVSDVGLESFLIYFYNGATAISNVSVNWIAIQ